MRPFDLEAAKRGEPICMRNGKHVTFIAHCPTANLSNRVIIHYENGDVVTRYEDGTSAANQIGPSNWDLFMAPKKRTVSGWVNVFEDGISWYPTEDRANHYAYTHRIGGRAHFVTFEIEE